MSTKSQYLLKFEEGKILNIAQNSDVSAIFNNIKFSKEGKIVDAACQNNIANTRKLGLKSKIRGFG